MGAPDVTSSCFCLHLRVSMLTEGLFLHEPGIRKAHNASTWALLMIAVVTEIALGLQSQGIVLIFPLTESLLLYPSRSRAPTCTFSHG